LESAAAPGRPAPVIKKTAKPIFTDVSQTSSFAETAQHLYERGIIAGYPSDVRGQLFFKPNQNINRAEFTQITLKMLCILPREEAKVLPTPFYDVLDPKVWFYPVLKEGNLRGFIKGYIGESRQNPATGQTQTPFKPANNITWAEAATVTLAALQEQNVIDMSSVDLLPSPGAPWYEKYLIVAQNLKPYLRDPDNALITFLLTSEEAKHPGMAITRGEFAMLAERVLLFRDCYDLDRDGLLDDFERKFGDPSKIGPDDIPPETPSLPPETATDLKDDEGTYVLRPACGNVCPCQATLGPGGDLQSGDLIFAAITGKGGVPIYAKSNEESY
ncbi:MAG: S-layer homology domain-containing protein, partial [bacterium]|nr:S-layer homology domain-containing protein [bacterium]